MAKARSSCPQQVIAMPPRQATIMTNVSASFLSVFPDDIQCDVDRFMQICRAPTPGESSGVPSMTPTMWTLTMEVWLWAFGLFVYSLCPHIFWCSCLTAGYSGSDAELADMEEVEAIALQKRLAQSMDDGDYDIVSPTTQVYFLSPLFLYDISLTVSLVAIADWRRE